MKRVVKNCCLLTVVGASCFVFAKPAPFAWRLTVEEPDGKVVEVTSAAPPTISPTKMEPVMRTPHLSSSIPQSTRPPKMQSTE